MNRLKSRLFIGAMASLFAMGLFLQSCSSNSSTPTSSTDAAVPLVSASSTDLASPNFTIDLSKYDNVTAMDPSPGGGRDTTIKGGGPDTNNTGDRGGNGGPGGKSPNGSVRLRPLPLPCLGLDSAQMQQLQQIMADAATAAKAARDAYMQAMAPIRTQDSIAMAAYRAATADVRAQLQTLQQNYRQQATDILKQVKDGTMTRTDAKTALDALRAQFAADAKPLLDQMAAANQALRAALSANDAARKAANDAYQSALKQIQDDMNAKIGAILTPAQLVIWQQWLAGGNPCAGIRPHK